MKRTLTMLCLGLALTLSMAGCTRDETPQVTPNPMPPATVSPGVDDAGRDMTDGVGDVARGVADGVGDMARDVGNGVKNAVR